MNASRQIQIFDRAQVRRNRARAVAGFFQHRVLFDEVEWMLRERVADVKAPFSAVLAMGAFETVVRCGDAAPQALCLDEEYLPFGGQSLDLIVSTLHLHWVNDLPGALIQIRHALRENGLFLAALLGGSSLQELRACMMEAEMNVTGGLSPRFSPVVDSLTASHLMQRAGFQVPVVDSEKFILSYPDLFALMRDVRGMGEGNAHIERLRVPTRRAVFTEAARLYQARYGLPDGRLPATFEVIFLHGWR